METKDRRNMRRYRTKERALLAIGPEKENVFHILDISRGGAGFRYIGKESRTNDLHHVDLYFQDSLWLKNIKVSLVQDIQMLNGMIPFRRCGLCFLELSDEQAVNLKSYVKRISVDEV